MVHCPKCTGPMLPCIVIDWPGGKGFVCPACATGLLVACEEIMNKEWDAEAPTFMKSDYEAENELRWAEAN